MHEVPAESVIGQSQRAWPDGFRHLSGYLSTQRQEALVRDVLARVELFWFRASTPRWGQPLSVRMANLGEWGWVGDKRGYRYEAAHPETGRPWPAMPSSLLDLWAEILGPVPPPECCLVNHYAENSKMGLHQDRDEATFSVPVLSVSLGDTALFRVGGFERGQPTRSVRLLGGDIVVLGGESRLAYHGIDRIYPKTSDIVPGGGRINLTLRRVTA